MKSKTIRKNRSNKNEKTIKTKKENAEPQTASTIPIDTELPEEVLYSFRMREYNNQINELRKTFNDVFEEFNFSTEVTFYQQEFLTKLFSFTPISIDRLFDQNLNSFFNKSYSFDDLLPYLRLLNNSLQIKHPKIILSFEGERLFLTKEANRQENQYPFKGRFISELEKEVHQNRANFMEKIRNNQSKYEPPNSQLSEISQELLFLSKVYMENCSKIKIILEGVNFSENEKIIINEEKSTEIEYCEILIQKNINYAFSNENIDFLNFYIQKEIEENNHIYQANKINSKDELLDYLKYKKSKKGKFTLPTACSCCFSHYFETYNPFLTCENCNLRCHKLCYNFKEKSCGNCSYQRILRSEKEKTPFCLICKQRGEMAIKIGCKTYAHGFCLLFHNLWEVKSIINPDQNVKNIENKNTGNIQTKLHQDIRSTNNSFNHKSDIVYYDLERINKFPLEISLLEKEDELVNSYFSEDFYLQKQKKSVICCELCSKEFHGNFWISCKHCNKKYHAFCSFFAGHTFEKCKKINQTTTKSYETTCCQHDQTNLQEFLQKKRRFILNKDRYLFELNHNLSF